MKRKAQIKLWTTISILVVFFVLLMLGFIFYARFQEIGIRRNAERDESLRSLQVAQAAANLPELKCNIGTVEKGACFDYHKLEAAETVFNDEFLYYFDYFGYADIVVRKVNLPGDLVEKSWEVYMNDGDKQSANSAFIPVSIYNSSTEPYPKFYFGMLEVKTYYD